MGTSDMPLDGPRTPSNLKLSGIASSGTTIGTAIVRGGLLLGVCVFVKAANSGGSFPVVSALSPFSFALYAYGISILIVPLLVVLLVLSRWRSIRGRWAPWIISLILAGVIAMPMALFVLTNYVTKRTYSFERHFPFTIPLLPVMRLSQLTGGNVIVQNLRFAYHGFQDFTTWNQIPGVWPLPWFVILLALIGIGSVMRKSLQARCCTNPFLVWLIASIPLLLIIPVNINRANTLFLPLIALAGGGVATLLETSIVRTHRLAFGALAGIVFITSTIAFAQRYFGQSYAMATIRNFNPTLPSAMNALRQLQGPDEAVYITDSVSLNYVQTLFYQQIQPKVFQESGATYLRPDFGPYIFNRESVASSRYPVAFVLRNDDPPLCAGSVRVQRLNSFVVGVCASSR